MVDEGDTVWPGLHWFEASETNDKGYGVVWWDPRALTLNVPQSFGIRQEELLKESDDPDILKRDLETYKSWETRRENVRRRAAQPSVIFRTATAQARSESGPGEPGSNVEVIELPRDPNRPSGPRFGALVHAALAAVSLNANADQVRRIAALYGRVLGADERETAAAAAIVQSALVHPLMARARHASAQGRCRRETPITVTLTGGMLVEGVIDLAFFEKDAWTVVDFKTDREIEKDLQHYERQVGLYMLSIARATGMTCGGILMRV
jgi:ATP-dependent exoDNAse (exonuclease V) beta subunit